MHDLSNGNMIASNLTFFGDYEVEHSSACDSVRTYKELLETIMHESWRV